MRHSLTAGLLAATITTSVSLCFGGAAYAANPSVPGSSPYTLMGVAPSAAGGMFAPAPVMSETRAGYVDNGAAYVANPNVPSYSPFAIMPRP